MKRALAVTSLVGSTSSCFVARLGCVIPPPRRSLSHVSDALHQKENARMEGLGRFFATASSTSTSSASTTTPLRQQQIQWMQDILYRVRDVNYLPDEVRTSLLEFRVDGVAIGKVRPGIAKLLCNSSPANSEPVFQLETNDDDDDDDTKTKQPFLTLNDKVAGKTLESRSQAVARVTEQLRQDGIVKGWRDELYPIGTTFYDPPLFLMERAAVSLLGAIEYGVHINGLVRPDVDGGETKMWMARRSATKSKYPGMLDHIVAGGQPAGMSLMDNVIKECLEEANIPESITRAGIRPAGAISYEAYLSNKDTVTRAVLFNFDLYLPPDFEPTPVDGEVQEFFLWTMKEVLQSMAKDYPDPIKPNCYSVIIDYLIREQGHLVSPDIPGYLDVVRELRSGDCR